MDTNMNITIKNNFLNANPVNQGDITDKIEDNHDDSQVKKSKGKR
ncbi:hypothetical protein [Anaerocolumna sp.]|nr:hypothetical protein [Anaerocolumna sp.]